VTARPFDAEQEELRRQRAAYHLHRARLMEATAERVRDILVDGLDDDGAITLEGAIVLAYRELRPAIDDLLDTRRP